MKTYNIYVKVVDKENSYEYHTKCSGKSGETAKDDVVANEHYSFKQAFGRKPDKIIATILNPDTGSIPSECYEEDK